MREIKFRYYDFNDKEMYYDVQNCYDYGHFGSFGDLLKDIASGLMKGELMQYTGLYDKNGKEIYEGDILQYAGQQKVFVSYKKGQFVISYYALNLLCDRNNQCEVIGNIFENEELIGGVN